MRVRIAAAVTLALGALAFASVQAQSASASISTASRTSVATAAPASARPAPSGKREDRAYWLVGGEWTCKTFGGSAFTRTYAREADAVSLVAETVVNFGGHTGTLREVYKKHKDADKWEVTLADGQLVVVGAPWYGTEWTFDGHDSEPSFDGRVKMTYRIVGAEAFNREFARFRGSTYIVYAGERCERKPNGE